MLRRFGVGTHVVAANGIVYADSGVEVDAGDKGVVVEPTLVQPIVRVIWDDHPGRSFTTNVGSLDPCDACAGVKAPTTKALVDHARHEGRRAAIARHVGEGLQAATPRERDRAKASGERVCRICACSDRDACPGGCAWVAPDLCSACEGEA